MGLASKNTVASELDNGLKQYETAVLLHYLDVLMVWGFEGNRYIPQRKHEGHVVSGGMAKLKPQNMIPYIGRRSHQELGQHRF